MSFSMLFCIVFTMGAVLFDCKWEKVPNLWIIAGLQISMAEHLSGEVIQGLGSAVIRFWGGIFLVLFLFFPLFSFLSYYFLFSLFVKDRSQRKEVTVTNPP